MVGYREWWAVPTACTELGIEPHVGYREWWAVPTLQNHGAGYFGFLPSSTSTISRTTQLMFSIAV